MKGRKTALALMLCFALLPTVHASADFRALVPVGSTIGIELKSDGVSIVGLCDVAVDGGSVSPARDAGLQAGDKIVNINGRKIESSADFLTEAAEFSDAPSVLTVQRGGKDMTFTVTPAENEHGAYQLGLWLRDGVSGIGTMTYYDPESGSFGALGHGINDNETGALVDIQSGTITSSEVVDVVKGSEGTPGELCGKINGDDVLGQITMNTPCGIFGVLDCGIDGDTLPVASESEIVLGPATILSNAGGAETREYDVEISRIYRSSHDSRSMLLCITDPELLSATGGIVQGMSGSPILQNGKLIGAVTHVLISDPTRGYGISMENMLRAAE